MHIAQKNKKEVLHMLKTTQREIKKIPAIDITMWREEKLAELPRLEEIAYSIGVYGCNGKLFRGTDGEFYKITSRSTNLFRF